MPTDENTRLRIRQYLIDLMDQEAADAMMESMPPIPWTELATKDDIVRLETRFDDKFDTMTERLDTMNERIDDKFDTMNERFDTIGDRIDTIGDRIGHSGEQIDGLLGAMHNEMLGLEGRLSLRFMEATRLIVVSVVLLFAGVLAAAAALIATG